jgi:hypothetical protein
MVRSHPGSPIYNSITCTLQIPANFRANWRNSPILSLLRHWIFSKKQGIFAHSRLTSLCSGGMPPRFSCCEGIGFAARRICFRTARLSSRKSREIYRENFKTGRVAPAAAGRKGPHYRYLSRFLGHPDPKNNREKFLR